MKRVILCNEMLFRSLLTALNYYEYISSSQPKARNLSDANQVAGWQLLA